MTHTSERSQFPVYADDAQRDKLDMDEPNAQEKGQTPETGFPA